MQQWTSRSQPPRSSCSAGCDPALSRRAALRFTEVLQSRLLAIGWLGDVVEERAEALRRAARLSFSACDL